MVRKAFADDKPWRENFGMAVVGRSIWQHSVFYLSYFERKCTLANLRVMSVARDAYSFQDALLLERLDTRRSEKDELAANDSSAVQLGHAMEALEMCKLKIRSAAKHP
jgi:hypothetical protein